MVSLLSSEDVEDVAVVSDMVADIEVFNQPVLLLEYLGETPFRQRENLHKYTHLKGPMGKITSVAIPTALATASLVCIGKGIYKMSHGAGKIE
ncbi:hypothetical protein LIER_30901 [Lithospermum erythrorhizon]|uniref:Uncharacterized protein n=1 Tax=Lithospermum erythrorhizon TaxID=34254 RepID=A0AAV3RPV7_LITER